LDDAKLTKVAKKKFDKARKYAKEQWTMLLVN
jgi:hypothetical protein